MTDPLKDAKARAQKYYAEHWSLVNSGITEALDRAVEIGAEEAREEIELEHYGPAGLTDVDDEDLHELKRCELERLLMKTRDMLEVTTEAAIKNGNEYIKLRARVEELETAIHGFMDKTYPWAHESWKSQEHVKNLARAIGLKTEED